MVEPSIPGSTRKKTQELTLEQELGRLFDELVVAGTPSGRKALQLRLGLTGTPPATLAVAASAVGLTRERVRQLESRFIKTLQRVQPPTPVLDEALEVVAEILPATALEIERALVERGFTQEGYSFRSLLKAAKLLGRPVAFSKDADVAVLCRPGAELPRRFVFSQARGLTQRWGASTFEVLLTELARVRTGNPDPALAGLHLAAMPGFEWLDDGHEWFWVKNAPPSNRLVNQIEKIMVVAGALDAGELRAGVARHPRMEGFRPPREVLARLCVQSGRYRREGDRLLQGADHRSWESVLGPSVERRIVAALFEHGPVMESADLERAVAGKWGVSRGAFEFNLRYSPVLTRYAPGVYGLRGARVTPDQVQALIPPRLQHQCLLDHRWTEDGRAWLGYPVSSATLHGGTFDLPPLLRGCVTGTYSLTTDRGWGIGTLQVTDSRVQELGPFFRRWGIEEGDWVLFNLDVARGVATVTAGGEELLLRFQAGE